MTITLNTDNPPAVHNWTGPTGVKFRDIREPSGTYYHDTTPRAVIDGLESAMRSGERVRFWLGDRETGKSWHDENDVTGTVSRSMGWKKIAILISSARSHGGPAILADCIICLRVGGREVYRHPGFALPSIRIEREGMHTECPIAAYVDGQSTPHARFATLAKAQRWAAFMRGERATK